MCVALVKLSDGRVGRSVSYGCSHGNNCIQRSYRDYNWSAITTVISFTATNLSQVVATARAHDVRVIQGVMYTEHGQPSARFNTSCLEDPAYTAQWVGAAVDQVVANGVDGFQLDVEHFHSPTPRMKALFTAFVCSLQSRLQAANKTLFAVDTQVWGNTAIFDLPVARYNDGRACRGQRGRCPQHATIEYRRRHGGAAKLGPGNANEIAAPRPSLGKIVRG